MHKTVAPMFHVPDVRRTVEWYRDLGFEVTETFGDGRDGLSHAIMAFGAGDVMFSAGGQLSSKHRREVDLYVYTEEVDTLHERIKDRVEVVEGPHNMFYGMREVIIRDLNGFWITFGQDVPLDVVAPWPPVDSALLQPYAGRFTTDTGMEVVITIQDGRLLAFPDDSPGVFLMPSGPDAFTPMMMGQAQVVFEGNVLKSALMYAQGGKTLRFVRVP